MTGINHGVVWQNVETLTDGFLDLLAASSGKICSAHAEFKKSVAAKEKFIRVEADAAWCVAGSVDYFQLVGANADYLSIFSQDIRWGKLKRPAQIFAEIQAVICEQFGVSGMDEDFRAQGFFEKIVAADVVAVAVGVHDEGKLEL